MDAPKPPFHSVTDELLYSIYLKMQTEAGALTPLDISTLAKLNALLTDAELVSEAWLSNAINLLKGNPPEAGNTLEKLYNIIQGLNYLSAEDIDTLAELNIILGDADVVKTVDLTSSIEGIKGNVPEAGNTLEKLFNLISNQPASRSVQFRFNASGTVYEMLLFKGQIRNLAHDFTSSLSAITYRSRLDISNSWVDHNTLNSLQSWIMANVTGNEINGTKYWIKSVVTYKQGKSGEAANILSFQIN